MDEDWSRRISVEISKTNFLLENLYAAWFKEHRASPADVDRFSDEACRQAMLPATHYGGEADPKATAQMQELLSLRLEMFFAGVRRRLETDRKG